ncbi:MAG TPA: VCBS repeat-containing protein, partial [Verrucomicrobiae bacterium]|nr:VCBS repeat-containing protein [Verrucomicrobiae bacterium]
MVPLTQSAQSFSRLAWRCLIAFVTLWFTTPASAYDWQTGPGFRRAPLAVTATGRPGFTLVPERAAGILFSNPLPASISITNQILLDGSGVAAGDVDGDGWCDLYFCAIDGRNALYRNLGNW